MLDTGCWKLDTIDAGLDTTCWILYAGLSSVAKALEEYWMLDYPQKPLTTLHAYAEATAVKKFSLDKIM